MMFPLLLGSRFSPFFSSAELNEVRLLEECVTTPYQTNAPPTSATDAHRSRGTIPVVRKRDISRAMTSAITTIGIAR